MTLNEYILQYRLKQAIDKMAESPNSPLSAISDQVGFSDYKYFAKVFKKYLHISPKKLKSLGRNQKVVISIEMRTFFLV
ncbi:AraC family transcriptional regulator [Streptococcus pneumoniae]|nr:AraC family transcriptional regulator [Streptococcus pneumoniae]